MSSYVLIDYDTTQPEIEIHAPSYTTDEITNVITIEANEALSNFQEFYVIDSFGNRYDYTFQKEDDTTYVGKIRFNTMPFGIVTFYARVKDDVGNISKLISKPIRIRENVILLNLVMDIKNRDVVIFDNPLMELDADDSAVASLNLVTNVKGRDIDLSDKARVVTNSIKELLIEGGMDDEQ